MATRQGGPPFLAMMALGVGGGVEPVGEFNEVRVEGSAMVQLRSFGLFAF